MITTIGTATIMGTIITIHGHIIPMDTTIATGIRTGYPHSHPNGPRTIDRCVLLSAGAGPRGIDEELPLAQSWSCSSSCRRHTCLFSQISMRPSCRPVLSAPQKVDR